MSGIYFIKRAREIRKFRVAVEQRQLGNVEEERDLLFFAVIGVRAGGARGAAVPPKFGQLRFFGQQEKIWAKPVFKDVSMFFIIIIILKR